MNTPPTPVRQMIPLSAIRHDPTPNRTDIDPAQLAELQANMAAIGQTTPIRVRATGAGTYEIIAGERRFLAAQNLKWSEIEADVYPPETTPTQTEVLSLVDDLQRDDLNAIEQVRAYKRLTEPPHDLGREEIAALVGKDQGVISRALALLELPKVIQGPLRTA
jgi:ParB family transcriptional regulator, chromosome partitioning protein